MTSNLNPYDYHNQGERNESDQNPYGFHNKKKKRNNKKKKKNQTSDQDPYGFHNQGTTRTRAVSNLNPQDLNPYGFHNKKKEEEISPYKDTRENEESDDANPDPYNSQSTDSDIEESDYSSSNYDEDSDGDETQAYGFKNMVKLDKTDPYGVKKIDKALETAKKDDQGDGGQETKWNHEFQIALETETKKQDKPLAKISANFSSVATLYGQVIALETCLKDKKTRAIQSKKSFGGLAGGEKIITRNILFKLCKDTKKKDRSYMYGGKHEDYELAAKSAGHELKGAINALSACVDVRGEIKKILSDISNSNEDEKEVEKKKVVEITTAIMCVIDNLGLRLTAMPILPLDDLLYGSADAMRHVWNDELFHRSMAIIAKHVHLALHYIGRAQRVQLYTAGDVEGHRGKDKHSKYQDTHRYYLLDTARFFPPECPKVRSDLELRGNTPFYRMLRPEYLQILKTWGIKPLNADVWTGWSDWNSVHQNANRNVTIEMFDNRIPNFAKKLTEGRGSRFSIPELHKQGINVRHMGLLRCNSSKKFPVSVKDHTIVQMFARTIKNIVRTTLRFGSKTGKSKSELEILVLEVLNKVTLAKSDITDVDDEVDTTGDRFWKDLRTGIVLRFGGTALRKEEGENFGLVALSSLDSPNRSEKKKHILDMLIPVIVTMLSIEISVDVPEKDFLKFSFTQADLEISLNVKQFDTMDFALANMFFSEAENAQAKDTAFRLYELSSQHFKNVIAVAPFRKNVEWYEARSHIYAMESKQKYPESAIRFCLVTQSINERDQEADQKKKEYMESFDVILKHRKNWKCTLEEIRELQKLLNITTVETFRWAETKNENVKFEISPGYYFRYDKCDKKDIDFIMELDQTKYDKKEMKDETTNSAKLEIKDDHLTHRGLRLIGGMLLGRKEFEKIQIADGPEINMKAFEGDNATFTDKKEESGDEKENIRKRLADREFIAISSFLKINKTLTKVTIESNETISHYGKDAITSAIMHNSTIVHFGKIPFKKFRVSPPNFTEFDQSKKSTQIDELEALVLAACLGKNSSVKKLNLKNNQDIKKYGAEKLSRAIFESKTIENCSGIKVKELTDENNDSIREIVEKHVGDTEVMLIALILKKNSFISKLDLSQSNISDAGAKALAEGLEALEHSRITDVNVMDNERIGEEGALALSHAITDSNTITRFSTISLQDKNKKKIDLSEKGCGDTEALVLASVLENGNNAITNLDLSFNPFINQTGAIRLAAAVVNCRSMKEFTHIPVPGKRLRKELILTHRGCGDTEAILIGKLLGQSQNLTKLILNGNNITCVGCTALASVFTHNTTLKICELKRNDIGLLGYEALAVAFGKNNTLNSIDIRKNQQINEDIAAKIGRSIVKNSKILTFGGVNIKRTVDTDETYDLSNRSLGDVEAAVIAQLVEKNTVAITLNLSQNRITHIGAYFIAKAIKNNTTLTEVNMNENYIGNEGAKYFAEAFKINSFLRNITLEKNNIEEAGISDLGEALSVNASIAKFCLAPEPQTYNKENEEKEEEKNAVPEVKIDEVENWLSEIGLEKQYLHIFQNDRKYHAGKSITAVRELTPDELDEILSERGKPGSIAWIKNSLKTFFDSEYKPTILKTLYAACLKNNLHLVHVLTRQKADLEKTEPNGDNPLTISSFYRRQEIVTHLLNMKAEMNHADNDGETALYSAAKGGAYDITEMLLQKKANVNKARKDGWTPLLASAHYGEREIVSLLLNYSADCEMALQGGETPFYQACQNERYAIVDELVQHRAKVDHRTLSGYTALYIACQKENYEMLDKLIALGADADVPATSGFTALSICCQKNKEKLVRVLVNATANLNKPSQDGTTPLGLASRDGYMGCVQMLLEKHANVEYADKQGATPLFAACENGRVDMFETLMNAKADIYHHKKTKASLFHVVCYTGKEELFRHLLTKEYDLTSTIAEGANVIHLACVAGHESILDELLKLIPDCIHEMDHLNKTPLYIAAEYGYLDIVRKLIEMNASINTCSTKNESPFLRACLGGYADVAKLLLDHQADVTRGRNTEAILNACGQQHFNLNRPNTHYPGVVQILIEARASLEEESVDKYTPLLYACWFGRLEIVELLVKNKVDVFKALTYHPDEDNAETFTPIQIVQNSIEEAAKEHKEEIIGILEARRRQENAN